MIGTKNFKISSSSLMLKNLLDNAKIIKKNKLIYGQARLLVDASLSKYYGYSMSGCVYNSIYKSSDELKKLIKEKKVIYNPFLLVDKVEEVKEKVHIIFYNINGKKQKIKFDRVFVAAGATNSTRIVMNSLSVYNYKATMKSRGGYVVPIFSFTRLPSDWPNCNTQPDLFIELKNKVLKNWVHIQVSTENELLREKFRINKNSNLITKFIKNFIINHTFITFVNLHSNYAGNYELYLTKSSDKNYTNILHTKHQKKHAPLAIILNIFLNLFSIFYKAKCIPIFFMSKLNSSSYHVGGTMPMRKRRKKILDTDSLGRIKGWSKIHIIDSSTFPSLPGTTIGLLLMSNAYRIVNTIYEKNIKSKF